MWHIVLNSLHKHTFMKRSCPQKHRVHAAVCMPQAGGAWQLHMGVQSVASTLCQQTAAGIGIPAHFVCNACCFHLRCTRTYEGMHKCHLHNHIVSTEHCCRQGRLPGCAGRSACGTTDCSDTTELLLPSSVAPAQSGTTR